MVLVHKIEVRILEGERQVVGSSYKPSLLSAGVIGNTFGFEPKDFRFEPWVDNMAKDHLPIEEPTHWVSLKTSNAYSYNEYAPVDEPKKGWLPLPKEGYPYTLMYEETKYGKWIRTLNKI